MSLPGKLFALFIIGVFCMLAGWLGLMIADREPPIIMLSSKVLTPHVKPGGELQTAVHFIRTRQCAVSVSRFLTDGANKRHILGSDVFPAGTGPVGEDTFTAVVKIPLDVLPGEATYQSTTLYRCNPFHAVWPIQGLGSERHFIIDPP